MNPSRVIAWEARRNLKCGIPPCSPPPAVRQHSSPTDGIIQLLDDILLRARKKKLSSGLLNVLANLAIHESASLGALSRHLGITTAAITGLADKLADLGYAYRIQSKKDRRTISLIISESGRTAIHQVAGTTSPTP